MKSFVVALLLCSAGPAFAQNSSPFVAPPDLDQLLPSPPKTMPGKPPFRFDLPDKAQRFFVPPQPRLQNRKPSPKADIDPGIIRKPQGFAQWPARPAPRSDVYPDLKIQPTEIALLGTPSLPVSCPRSNLTVEPIPRTYPKAKVEPIPITADCLRMVPVDADSGKTP